jgi:hypothetical protein
MTPSNETGRPSLSPLWRCAAPLPTQPHHHCLYRGNKAGQYRPLGGDGSAVPSGGRTGGGAGEVTGSPKAQGGVGARPTKGGIIRRLQIHDAPFTRIEIHNYQAGQFFTPYPVCHQ